MTVSTYHINNVLKAYTKQNRTKVNVSGSQEPQDGQYKDVVSLSAKGTKSEEAFNRISYTLLDAITRRSPK